MSRRKRMHGRRRRRSPIQSSWGEKTFGWMKNNEEGEETSESPKAAANKNTKSAQQEAKKAAMISSSASESGGGGGEHSHGDEGIANIKNKEKPWNVGSAIGEMEGMDRTGRSEYMQGLTKQQRARVVGQQMKDRRKERGGMFGGLGQAFGW